MTGDIHRIEAFGNIQQNGKENKKYYTFTHIHIAYMYHTQLYYYYSGT